MSLFFFSRRSSLSNTSVLYFFLPISTFTAGKSHCFCCHCPFRPQFISQTSIPYSHFPSNIHRSYLSLSSFKYLLSQSMLEETFLVVCAFLITTTHYCIFFLLFFLFFFSSSRLHSSLSSVKRFTTSNIHISSTENVKHFTKA